jgi:hypothetical protein
LIYGNLYPRLSNEYFHSDQYLTQEIKIDDSQDKISITVNVYGVGQANWIFRDCQRTEAFKLFQ